MKTDASGVGVEAIILLQENEGKLYPVSYTSKKIEPRKPKYPIIEKKCLYSIWGIKCFKHCIQLAKDSHSRPIITPKIPEGYSLQE